MAIASALVGLKTVVERKRLLIKTVPGRILSFTGTVLFMTGSGKAKMV